MDEPFEQVIREHLELKRRNSHLDEAVPLSVYLGRQSNSDAETGGVGPAFDTAEWKGAPRDRPRRRAETFLESLEDVWSSGPVFDWGDDRPA